MRNIHFYCPECKELLGPLEGIGERAYCPHCKKWPFASDIIYTTYKVDWDGQWCSFLDLEEALSEAREILLEDPEVEVSVKVSTELMRLEDFNNLPEFPGW